MTVENFLSFLQQLLTIVNPNDQQSVNMVKSLLLDLKILSDHDTKTFGRLTYMTIAAANSQIDFLIEHSSEFAGKTGEYDANYKKRQRLHILLAPHC